jgi:hypothetical protein
MSLNLADFNIIKNIFFILQSVITLSLLSIELLVRTIYICFSFIINVFCHKMSNIEINNLVFFFLTINISDLL